MRGFHALGGVGQAGSCPPRAQEGTTAGGLGKVIFAALLLKHCSGGHPACRSAGRPARRTPRPGRVEILSFPAETRALDLAARCRPLRQAGRPPLQKSRHSPGMRRRALRDQSAASAIGNPQWNRAVDPSSGLRIANPRYSRLAVGATERRAADWQSAVSPVGNRRGGCGTESPGLVRDIRCVCGLAIRDIPILNRDQSAVRQGRPPGAA